MQKSKSYTLWFIGLHCSGKTTISKIVADKLRSSGNPLVLLDGDEVRKHISSDLGYSLEDRHKHLERVAHLSSVINENNVISIACVASPTKQSRDFAKSVIPNIITIFVNTSVEECEKRDVKGHYKKARANEPGFESFLGINLPFEEPNDADIVVETEKQTVEECANQILDKISNQ